MSETVAPALRGAQSEEKKVNGDSAGYDYDLAVIGGGSGGMAAAKEAARHGAKVVLFDYVKPRRQVQSGALVGLVNARPKKLMHHAAISLLHDAHHFGWRSKTRPKWSGPSSSPTCAAMYTPGPGRLGAGAKVGISVSPSSRTRTPWLPEAGQGRAHNADGRQNADCRRRSTMDPSLSGNTPSQVTISSASTSAGRRPGQRIHRARDGGLPQRDGYDTTVAVRSVYSGRSTAMWLRRSTRSTASRQVPHGHHPPTDREGRGRRPAYDLCQWRNRELRHGPVRHGAVRDTRGLNLEHGLQVDEGDFPPERADECGQHLRRWRYPGDRPEHPSAIKDGELLARRLFAGATKQMDWDLIPTTVFTPTEYGCVGLSEQTAVERHGDDVVTYLWQWSTLEHQAAHRLKAPSVRNDDFDTMPPNCLAKLVCLASQEERVVGFHFVGPNAGRSLRPALGLAVPRRAT